jgi:hypothetical protein
MKKSLILFIHGFLGNSSATWGKFPDFIRADERMASQFDIHVDDYVTMTTIHPLKRVPGLQIEADALRSRIDNTYHEYIDISLVTHSMGGVIALRYILDCVNNERRLPVTRLLAFAVPFTGASLAAWWKLLGRNLENLDPTSDFMYRLQTDLQRSRNRLSVEMKAVVGGRDRVVPPAGVALIDPSPEIVQDCDHSSIVKPPSAEALSFMIAKRFLSRARPTLSDLLISKSENDRVLNTYEREAMPDTLRVSITQRIETDLGERGWRLDRMTRGQGCINPAFNKELLVNPPVISLRVLNNIWAAEDLFHKDLRPFVIADARKKSKGDLFNDEKIRLASDFIEADSRQCVIQRTNYLSSLMTDQLGWDRVRSAKVAAVGMTPQLVIWDWASAFVDDRPARTASRLKAFSETSISNQIGGSTLAFSSDGHLMIVYQNAANQQSARLLAPSGSGSFDWEDVNESNASDLLSLVRFGAQRELREECALDDDNGARAAIGSEVVVFGFARMLHRAGKPEFFCLGKINATATEICDRKPERYVECVLRSDVQHANFRTGKPSAEIRKVCSDYLDNRIDEHGEHIPLSYPLEHALVLLIEVCDETESAGVIDRFMLKQID